MITLADHQGKTVDKHLSFKKGETIIVRSQKDAAWYSGQLHGKVMSNDRKDIETSFGSGRMVSSQLRSARHRSRSPEYEKFGEVSRIDPTSDVSVRFCLLEIHRRAKNR